MPFIHLQTNQKISKRNAKKLLVELTNSVAEIKKRDKISFISGSVDSKLCMSFNGNADDAVAVFQMTATDFNDEITAALTRSFTASLQKYIEVDPKRVYVFFRDIIPEDRHLVGWNNKTFKEIFPVLPKK